MNDLLTIAEVCDYLRMSRSVFSRVRYSPGFPQAIVLAGGRPKWLRREVVEWTESQRECV